MKSDAQPGTPVPDPDVAATVRLLHRRHGWGWMALTSLVAFLLADGAYSSAQQQGTPPPFWFLVVVVVLAALAVVGILAVILATVILRRKSPAVRAQAAPLAARHPRRPHAHHFPPRHTITWALRWVGMLLLLLVAVVSVPAAVNGVGYLAGAGKTVTFDPVSYQTNCYQGGCQTSTDGILETGGTGVDATWPDVVPLDKPFKVRDPVWRWGLGAALIDSDKIAVVALIVGLLIEGAGVLVVFYLVRLVRNWRRHRRAVM